MPELLRFSVLLLLNLCSTNAQSDRNDIRASTTSLPAGSQASALSGGWSFSQNATCPSRTANYITHTLPQQCLRTDRASAIAANISETIPEIYVPTTTPSSVASHEGNAVDDHVNAASQSATTESSAETKPETVSPETHPTTTASSVETPTAVIQEPETETDSPLDNANFLSFEDWKRQNLVKAGQSPDNIGVRSQPLGGERKRPGINNALDTLGDESEIELDFSGFGASHDNDNRERSSRGASEATDAQSSLAPQTARSKDAGKTCKERTNYASFDCAATILKNNPESKSGSSVLVENKDSYMLNKCSAPNKFLIVELCNDILVDTIVLANYEFFSSIFRHFRISVSDRYPVKPEKWKDLGTFEARNTREVQAFLVENPLIWARYLRIEFLSHYGKEYYCPVSLLRVHGTTMMDEFRHQEEIARGESQDEEIVAEPDVPVQTAVPQEALTASPEVEQSSVSADDLPVTMPPESHTSAVPGDHAAPDGKAEESVSTCPVQSNGLQVFNAFRYSYATCPLDEGLFTTNTATSSSVSANGPMSSADINASMSSSHSAATAPRSGDSVTTTVSSEQFQRQSSQPSDSQNTITTAPGSNGKVENVNTSTNANQSSSSSTSSTIAAPPVSRPREEAVITSLPKSNTLPSDSTRAVPSSTTAHPAQPSTQESFFKSVHKRLQQLESNSTLSLQYIEEQSRILRDAFSKVEKRQLTSTTNFLAHLNSTVMGELQGFRKAYDQLWQSTVIELEGQREQYQREMLALSTRLTLVADELVWQKRMGIVQSTLLLLCLALVLFNRTGNSALVEMPLLQQMMNRSQAALRSGWESPTGSRSPEDRSPENRSPVSLFRKKLWRHSVDPGSGHATDATDNDSRPQSRDATHEGPDVTLRAPTPDLVQTDSEEEGEWKEVPEVQSGPATPRGTREALGSPTWIEGDGRPSSSLS
ncbi:hypothetical protein MBLNU13_g05334t1 [Cladosporium sp. NU13]